MAFTSNAPVMEQFCARLSALQTPSPVQEILRGVLCHVRQSASSFDGTVSTDSPFYREFFDALRSCNTCEDNCFSMLECLIVFCREKALRVGAAAVPSVEQDILQHFESSGMWDDPAQKTLVAEWYWSVLPQRAASAS